jgi:multidrug efflux pump subunit AcrB
MSGLASGLALSIVAIFLLLSANFQSPRLALVTASTIPATLAGVLAALWLTDTTVNIQSFIGAIMAAGVAMANGILLVSFAEQRRISGATAALAAVESAATRLRPILMTSAAMIAGMLPMALALGEGGEQTAPLGRAVIGGLAAATLATLFILPAIFAEAQNQASSLSASLDPDDAGSPNFDDWRPPVDQETKSSGADRPGLWLEKFPSPTSSKSQHTESDHVI